MTRWYQISAILEDGKIQRLSWIRAEAKNKLISLKPCNFKLVNNRTDHIQEILKEDFDLGRVSLKYEKYADFMYKFLSEEGGSLYTITATLDNIDMVDLDRVRETAQAYLKSVAPCHILLTNNKTDDVQEISYQDCLEGKIVRLYIDYVKQINTTLRENK